ncbi:phage holin family protein, partial [Bacillus sp. SIMBA_069]
ITAAVLGFALILPAWLSAIIVGVILLIIAVVVGLIGLRSLNKGVPPVPEDLGSELSADVQALKGQQP